MDGDRKAILGLVWTLILHYDIRVLSFKGKPSRDPLHRTYKRANDGDNAEVLYSEKALLRWAAMCAAPHNVPVNNLSSRSHSSSAFFPFILSYIFAFHSKGA